MMTQIKIIKHKIELMKQYIRLLNKGIAAKMSDIEKYEKKIAALEKELE